MMNIRATETQGSTSPMSRHSDGFDHQSQVSPSLGIGVSVLLIALIGISCCTWVIHNLKQGSITFKLKMNRWIETEFTIIKKK
jgi:hypothetical protein